MKRRYAYGWAYHSHRRTPLAKFTSTINQYFAVKEISVWADHAHGCAKAARNTGAQPHPRLVDRSPRELRRPSRNGTVRQRVRTRKKGCAQMSEQSQTWKDIRPTTTWWYQAPWTMGTHEGAESEHKGQPHDGRAVKAAETNKIRDYKPPPSTQAVHDHPDGIRYVRKVERKGGTGAETSSKKAGKT